MATTWQLQDAKNRFSELVDDVLKEGPQVVTRRGVETVVVISVSEFNRLNRPDVDLMTFFSKAPRVDLDIERNKDSGRNIEL